MSTCAGGENKPLRRFRRRDLHAAIAEAGHRAHRMPARRMAAFTVLAKSP
jgi:hypothetical protein